MKNGGVSVPLYRVSVKETGNYEDEKLVLDKQGLVNFAHRTYDLVKDMITDENESETIQEIIRKASESIEVFNETGYQQIPLSDMVRYSGGLKSNDGCVNLVGLVKWVHAGFPQINLGHKFAAALLVTNATEEVVQQVRPPFPAFMIEVPDGLLYVNNPQTNQQESIRRILVHKGVNSKMPEGWTWAYNAMTESMVSLFRYGVNSTELLPPELDGDTLNFDRRRNQDWVPGLSFEMTDQDKKIGSLIGRLIVNTCLAFSNPENVQKPKIRRESSSKSHGKSRKSSEPTVRVYTVGKEVKHDFREAVKDYLAGTRKKLSVQILVVGHYKMQPYGPKSAQRKLIWVEPFWRGPEDALISVRPHQMG
jgi:hypothetical protein